MSVQQLEQPRSTDSWDEYNFDWLFDPDRFDHLPIEEQVRHYKCRDLRQAKLYKCAARIWGEPRSRVRRIIAPPMCAQPEPPDPSDAESETVAPSSASLNARASAEKLLSGPVQKSLAIQVMPEAVASYEKWLGERKALRNGLESLGLNAEWLSRKPDKSPVELRVLQKILEEELILSQGLAKEMPQEVSRASPRRRRRPPTSKVLPVIKCPSPEAVLIIERFLSEKRLRLIDLFQDLDKDKDWRIGAEEFRNAIKRNAVPLTNVQVEELLMVFSADCTGSLNYRDLARCLETWRKEKREEAKMGAEAAGGRDLPDEGRSDVSPDMTMNRDTPNVSSAKSSASDNPQTRTEDACRSNGARSKSSSSATFSSLSSSRPSTSGFLEPPEPDLRPERIVASSSEAMLDLRRRNQHSLHLYSSSQERRKPGKGVIIRDENQPMIKTGDRVVDAHCAPSTIGGEKADSINRYRQLLLREYTQLCHLCRNHNLPLTTEILQKALLYPEDKHTFGASERIRQPADLLSKRFYEKGARDIPSAATAAARSRYQSSSTGIATASGFTTHAILGTPAESSTTGATASGTDVTQEGCPGLDRGNPSNKSAGGRNGELAKSFRSGKSLARNVPRTVRLSTGRARVTSKVDCWMTFEEFVQLTRETRSPRRRTRPNRPTKHNAYWPGQLLDKLCLVLDNDQRGNSIFHKVTKDRPVIGGYNNNIRTWPVNDSGYVLYGTIEK